MIAEVLQSAQKFDSIIAAQLKPHGITHMQLHILRALQAADKPLSVTGIRSALNVQSSDVTRLVDRLVAKELVQRTICPQNRRKVDVSISSTGNTLLQEVEPALEGALASSWQEKISSDEARQVSQILGRLAAQNTHIL